MPTVTSDDQVRANSHGGVRPCAREHSDDTFAVPDQINGFVPKAQVETRELTRFAGEEIEEIPLRHEGGEFAMSRHMGEIGTREAEVAEHTAGGSDLLVRQLQEIIEQVELI